MTKNFGAAAALRAALLVTGSTYVAFAAGLVANMLVARVLGPADYGRYAYLVWLSGILVMSMNNGLTTSMIRFVSESIGRADTQATQALHQWFWQRQWMWIAAVTVVFGLALPFLHPRGWEDQLWLVAAVMVVASIPKAWYLFGASVAKGHGRFGVEAKTMAQLSLLNLACVAVMFALGAQLRDYVILFLFINLAHPWLLSRHKDAVRREPGAGALEAELAGRVRNHYWWTALLALVAMFYGTSMIMPFLNAYTTPEAVGFFSVAASLMRGGVELLVSGLNTVLMPLMAHGYGSGGRERTMQITADAVRIFHFFGLLLLGIGVFWGQPLIQLLYGSRYDEAILPFQVLVAVGGLCMPASVLATLQTTTDRQRVRVTVNALAVMLFAATSWACIPTWGLRGALIAFAASTVAVYAMWLWVSIVRTGLRLHLGPMGRVTVAALVAATVSLGMLQISQALWMQVAAGLVYVPMYIMMTLVLRAWAAGDLALVESQSRRLGRWGRWAQGLTRWASDTAAR